MSSYSITLDFCVDYLRVTKPLTTTANKIDEAYVCVCIYTCIYIYIHIERERDRERERDTVWYCEGPKCTQRHALQVRPVFSEPLLGFGVFSGESMDVWYMS